MSRPRLDAPDALIHGAWVPERGVLRWVPRKPAQRPIVQAAMLIACPTCRARVGETCRTRSGHTTVAHGSRLAPRLCQCGALLARRRRYCDGCRTRAAQDSKNDHGRRHQEVKNRWGRVARFKNVGRCWIPLGGDYRSLCGLPVDACQEHAAERTEAAA